MSRFDRTPLPTMVGCPKCGFQQPADQYCANCGVDMTKVPKSRAQTALRSLRHPAFLTVLAIAVLIFTVNSVQTLRQKRLETTGESTTMDLRARIAERAKNSFAAKFSMGTLAKEIVKETANTGKEPNIPTPTELSSTPAAIQVHATPDSVPTKTTKPGNDVSTLQVTFAWAEVSHEWLQVMGAATPGFHSVPDLELRLRESVGGYRVLEVSRQKLADHADSIVLSHGGRLSVRFEITAANDSSFIGSIQPTMHSADGSIRSPAAAGISIDKGQGSIVTFGASAPASAVSPAGVEIVLLVLPRWDADRNPKQ